MLKIRIKHYSINYFRVIANVIFIEILFWDDFLCKFLSSVRFWEYFNGCSIESFSKVFIWKKICYLMEKNFFCSEALIIQIVLFAWYSWYGPYWCLIWTVTNCDYITHYFLFCKLIEVCEFLIKWKNEEDW